MNDPVRHYFTLVTQAVKLCSPYMDHICTISTHKLYEKAQKQNVPFHKWHLWIERQLTNAYLSLKYGNTAASGDDTTAAPALSTLRKRKGNDE
jgi:hypothetical protein